MAPREFIFFTLNNFRKDAGESVRIYGLANSLAEAGEKVILISNATDYTMFREGIKHFNLNHSFKHKKSFQGLLALLPATVVYKIYRLLFGKIHAILKAAGALHKETFFFDYLDNSIGYVLKKKGFIAGYINDIHGIANLEFEANIKTAGNIKDRAINKTKLFLAKKLDKKVFSNAAGFIFSSNTMYKYFSGLYPIAAAKSYIIPNVIDSYAAERAVNDSLKNLLEKQFNISPDDFVILFTGTYKNTSGVDRLITVFDRLCNTYAHLKLILVGDGPVRARCDALIQSLKWKEKIYTVRRIAYRNIATYQSLAHLIVCPDEQNGFSEMIVHLKYFDALLSGKIVLNGSFSSVMELNDQDRLSLSFTPSSTQSLYEKIEAVIRNYDFYKDKYAHTRAYALANLTYQSYIGPLILSSDRA
ncbi:MAG: glycosyltransferase family 4 protein [Niabella sp.]